MADEQRRLDPFERKYFARCLGSLVKHLEALRPLLGETHPSDQSINAARQLVQSFVLKETGHSAWDGIFQGKGSKTDDVDAKKASLRERTWGALPRVIVFPDDAVANSVSLSPPAYAAMKELLETLFHFSREGFAPTKIRTMAHELRDHAASFVELKTGKTWTTTESDRTTGVSLMDVALLVTDGEVSAAKRTKKRWHNLREPQLPTSIGNDPSHAQTKLYPPSAILEFARIVEGFSVVDFSRYLIALRSKTRRPRPSA